MSLHLDSGRDFRGGQRQVLCLLRGLQERGQRVLLCCPRGGPLFARAGAAGIPCRALTLRGGLDFPSAVRLARLVAGGDFDLVHAHDAHSHSIARAAQGICRHPALSQNLFVTRRSVGAADGAVARFKYNQPGTHYIAISMQVRAVLLRLGVDARRIAVVPSGVDTERLAAVRQAADPDPWGLGARRRRVVGTVGHLSREKNQALLLDAFARLRAAHHSDAHLLLAGDGPLRHALERRARELGLGPHVTFAGELDDVAPAYAAMHVFALSSDVEGLCTAALDAMAAGVPVVTTAAGGILDIATHGASALVVPTGDARALSGAFSRLLREPPLVAKLVEGGRRVARLHSIDHMVEGTIEAYTHLGRWPESATLPDAASPGGATLPAAPAARRAPTT